MAVVAAVVSYVAWPGAQGTGVVFAAGFQASQFESEAAVHGGTAGIPVYAVSVHCSESGKH